MTSATMQTVQSALTTRPPDMRVLTRALYEAMLEEKASHAGFPMEKARQLLALTYPEDVSQNTDAERSALIEQIAQSGDASQQAALMDVMARAAHLHQMASMLVRGQLLEAYPEDKPIDRLVSSTARAVDAVKTLNRPQMEFTFTAHPTNTNGVPFMRAQRRLAQVLDGFGKGAVDAADVQAAVKDFATQQIFPMRDGKVQPMRAQDETGYMLYFLQNAFDSLDGIYREFDAPLTGKYGDSYKPEELKLQVRFHSWGSSGDKDGNNNVNANTTLHALAEHKVALLMNYHQALNALGGPPEWQQRVKDAYNPINEVLGEINAAMGTKQVITSAQFDAWSKRIEAANDGFDLAGFTKAIEDSYHQSGNKPEWLSLLRKVRHFGLNLGNIEYRETAEEYERIIGLLIEGYAQMDETARQRALSELLDPANSEKLKAAVDGLRQRFAGIEGKPYSKEDALPIAYHTFKRMELARDFPDLFQNNVLAECQNTSNFLEALLLQRAVAEGEKAPKLGIVPLFEEYGVLANAPQIVQAALDHPAYQAHQRHLATAGDGREHQQVQLAHSDNARRAGSIGSRAAIYQAQDALQKMGIRRYQGGSQSDAYRDGVRSISGKINEFGLHDFAKMTFQGGDLLNYFNSQESTVRLISRNLAQGALALKENRRNAIMTPEDRKIVPALLKTIPNYEEIFLDERFSDFVERAGYKEQQQAGNFSSRAAARGGNSGKVSVPNTRTISFSETLEHAGLVPIWIGAKGLKGYLQDALADGGELTPELLHRYYEKSPLFKDVVDRLLYSTARSSFTPLSHMKDHPLMGRLSQEYSEAFDVAMEAYTGQPISAFSLEDATQSPTSAQRHLVVREAFSHTKDFIADQDRLMRNLHQMRSDWKMDGDAGYIAGATLHNAMDTVHHGRNWLIDDPGAAKIYCQAFDIVRPHMNGNGAGQGRG